MIRFKIKSRALSLWSFLRIKKDFIGGCKLELGNDID